MIYIQRRSRIQTLHSPHAYEHCSPCFLHVHLPVLQPGLKLLLIISINFMVQVTEKSGWVAFSLF